MSAIKLTRTDRFRCGVLRMFERKVVKKVTRRVWRMSATNPAGEFVAPSGRHANSGGLVEAQERGFRASSLDLLNGSDVVEADLNTLPGELVSELLKVGK